MDIYIYKCIKFPKKWIKTNELLIEGNFADSIIFKKDFLYTYVQGKQNNSYALIYSLENNKIELIKTINDKENMLRAAGKSFEYLNNVYFVSQDSSKTYGYGIFLLKININNFTFDIVSHISPIDYAWSFKKSELYGIHTFNFNEKYVVIDFLYETFSLYNFLVRFFIKFKKILHF